LMSDHREELAQLLTAGTSSSAMTVQIIVHRARRSLELNRQRNGYLDMSRSSSAMENEMLVHSDFRRLLIFERPKPCRYLTNALWLDSDLNRCS
jgi:hypothetical protein